MKLKSVFIPSVYTNCYLLLDQASGQGAVIDPGDGDSATVEAIRRGLEEEGCTLAAILLTHGHFDHTGGVSALRSAWPDAPVYLHPLDAGQKNARLFPVDGLGELLPLEEGQTLRVGGLSLQVLHTPGHTPGSVCFRCGDILFSGDTLFRGSCGRTDFPGGDWNAMLASLARLASLEGDLQVYPGHESATTLAEERKSNPFLRMGRGSMA